MIAVPPPNVVLPALKPGSAAMLVVRSSGVPQAPPVKRQA